MEESLPMPVREDDEVNRFAAIISSMAEGLVVSDFNGTVLMMNPAALRFLGYGDAAEARRNLRDFPDTFLLRDLEGQTVPLEAWPLARAARGETFSDYEVSVMRLDTGKASLLSFNGTPVYGSAGEVNFAILTLRDITEIKRGQAQFAFLAQASATLASSLDYQTTLSHVARLAVPQMGDWCMVDLADAQGRLRRVEVAHGDPKKQELARELEQRYPTDPNSPTGAPQVLRTGKSEFVPEITEEMIAASISDPEHRRIIQELGLRSYLCVPLIARDKTIGVITFLAAETGRRYGASDLELAEELARRAALAVDNAQLFYETKARAEREALLNKIGRALRVTMETDELLRITTREVGVALNVSRCNWAWINSARDAFEIAPQQYLASGVGPAATGYPFSSIPPEALDTLASGQPVFASAYIACPVFLRGQWAAIFTVHQTNAPRLWATDEIDLLTAVTDILALALENARLYAREHRVADMLQGAFLSNIPDFLPGLSLASSYRAGLEEAQVGGDFYDAFSLPDGRVALVMADVSGKGLNAAMQTATVKYSLRAFAAEAASPSLVLTRLNRTLRNESSGLGEHFVTLFYAVYDPATGRLTYASAGHEAQVIKRAAGGTTLLNATGPILGVAEHNYEQFNDRLKPGDSVVLFTDGLTEARSGETRELLDISRVMALLHDLPPEAGPGVITTLLQQKALDWTGGKPQDDMALLAARCAERLPEMLTPSRAAVASLFLGMEIGEQGRTEEGGQAREMLFDFTFPSRPEFAAEVRQAVGHWMEALGFDREAMEDFQTAVTEAVTNAVRHGAAGSAESEFRVSASRSPDGSVAIRVTDHGPGLPDKGRFPEMPGPEAPSGRGLPLMQELADTIEFSLTEEGHSVHLVKRRRERTLK